MLERVCDRCGEGEIVLVLVDLVLGRQKILRLRDPRRFGALLWCERDPLEHPLLKHLGPEPLSEAFDGDYLVGRVRAST